MLMRKAARGLPDGSYFLWDNQGDNPYHAMLGLAEQIIVTADSNNMVGEACRPACRCAFQPARRLGQQSLSLMR